MARTKKSYVDAAKKAARTRKRNSRTGMTTTTRKSTTTTRRRKRKKTGLSEMFTPAISRGGAMTAASGLAGGAAAAIIDNLLDKFPKPVHPGMRIAGLIGGGFIMATVLRMPNVGAGMAGIAGYKLMQQTGLAEGDDNARYANDIEQMPAMLDVNGQPLAEGEMYLEENGMDLQENSFDLEEGGYQVQYAPDFSNPTGGI